MNLPGCSKTGRCHALPCGWRRFHARQHAQWRNDSRQPCPDVHDRATVLGPGPDRYRAWPSFRIHRPGFGHGLPGRYRLLLWLGHAGYLSASGGRPTGRPPIQRQDVRSVQHYILGPLFSSFVLDGHQSTPLLSMCSIGLVLLAFPWFLAIKTEGKASKTKQEETSIAQVSRTS